MRERVSSVYFLKLATNLIAKSVDGGWPLNFFFFVSPGLAQELSHHLGPAGIVLLP
jgi:hypothetical protein